VKQWARNYLHATQRRPTPLRRARIRSYLYARVQLFKLPALVDGIPTLLHISLFLFFAGLFEFFAPSPIHLMIRYLALAILVICAGFYVTVALTASLFPKCPYQSPLSAVNWHLLRFIQLFQHRHHAEIKVAVSLVQEMESVAMGEIRERNEVEQRDLEALRWLLESLTDNDELEPFVAGIPEFLAPTTSATVTKCCGNSSRMRRLHLVTTSSCFSDPPISRALEQPSRSAGQWLV